MRRNAVMAGAGHAPGLNAVVMGAAFDDAFGRTGQKGNLR